MTWNTPYGARIITGTERLLIENAIYEMAMEILEADEEDSLEIGVAAFDSLIGWQQLVVLETVRLYLFEATPETHPETDALDGAITAIFAFIRSCVETELEAESKVRSKIQRQLFRKWRKLVYKACKTRQWEFNPRSDISPWSRAIDFLKEEIVAKTDAPTARDPMNLAEPTGSAMLALIRRLIGNL